MRLLPDTFPPIRPAPYCTSDSISYPSVYHRPVGRLSVSFMEASYRVWCSYGTQHPVCKAYLNLNTAYLHDTQSANLGRALAECG